MNKIEIIHKGYNYKNQAYDNFNFLTGNKTYSSASIFLFFGKGFVLTMEFDLANPSANFLTWTFFDSS